MRFHWLLLSFLSIFLFVCPAEAGKLVFWRFDSNQNRLVFTTDEGVQPQAQLIPNPTRLVIDLPGTVLGRPTLNQPLGSVIRNLRIGQFDGNTTRLVIELAPGYTLDPNNIKIRGSSPTQWSVELPTPERITSTPTTPTTPSPNTPTTPPTGPTVETESFKVTQNGFFVRIDGGANSRIVTSRSRDRRRIDFDLEGVSLPSDLVGKTLSVNRYNVSQIQFSQTASSKIRISLSVAPNSPNWQASFSRLGGLVLFPEGGISDTDSSNATPPSTPIIVTRPTITQSTIERVELVNNDTQLLIRANQNISARGSWNRQEGVYEIKISNAKLAEPLRGPQLNADSPISRIRLRQQDSQTVLILVQPALGVQIEDLNQPNERLLSLGLRRIQTASLPNSIPVPLPNRDNRNPSTSLPSVPQGRFLVVIDPGHGGKDPGTIGIGGIQEKDIILPISQQVADLLQQQGIQVKMTRNSDYFVSLEGRTQMANQAKADVFVSIHANAINLSRPDVNGLENYYYQQSSQRLAQIIHRNILQRVRVRDRGIRTARFYVLRNTSMPSVLIEVGFLTGQEDAANLTNPNYRRQMAEGITAGILEYIQQNLN